MNVWLTIFVVNSCQYAGHLRFSMIKKQGQSSKWTASGVRSDRKRERAVAKKGKEGKEKVRQRASGVRSSASAPL